MRAVEANASQDLSYVIEHVAVIDRLLESDMTEVTRAGSLIASAGLAKSVVIHSSHLVVVNSVGDRVTILLVDLFLCNLDDRESFNLFTAKNRKSDALNLMAFFVLMKHIFVNNIL